MKEFANKLEKTTTFVTWLVVIATTVFYIYYWRDLKDIAQLIVSLVPAILFLTGAILIFDRDRKRINKTKANQEYDQTLKATWFDAMKHDLLTYLVPAAILFMPFMFNEIPTITSVFQAVMTFLALTYIKYMYWGDL